MSHNNQLEKCWVGWGSEGEDWGVREEYARITDFLRICVTESLPAPHLLSTKASKHFATKGTPEEVTGNC